MNGFIILNTKSEDTDFTANLHSLNKLEINKVEMLITVPEGRLGTGS